MIRLEKSDFKCFLDQVYSAQKAILLSDLVMVNELVFLPKILFHPHPQFKKKIKTCPIIIVNCYLKATCNIL